MTCSTVVRRFSVEGRRSPASLLADELVVGLVVVERVDDVVAIPPGVGVSEVLVHAVGVGVAGHVEPVPAPALAVVRRGEQPVDDPREGVGDESVRNASTSSGVGGRPVRSKVARRMSVRLLAEPVG